MNKFKLVKVDDFVKWNNFVENSPQGSVFFNSEYLKYTGKNHALYHVIKGDTIKAGLSLILTDDGLKCKHDDFAIYNGIIFEENKKKNKAKTKFEQFDITEFIINELAQKYDNIEMQLSPHFEDLRPFLWHNYHNPSGNRFTLDLKYTSYVDINDNMSDNLAVLRRRNIKEALKSGATVTKGLEIELFLKFFEQLSNEISSDRLQFMGDFIYELIENNFAQMFLVKNSQNRIIYIIIFCFDSKRAYYLFGAGDPKAPERFKGTFGFWEAFRLLDVNQIDFEGVNSPLRGWFKLSFGGNLLPYYQVHLGDYAYTNK